MADWTRPDVTKIPPPRGVYDSYGVVLEKILRKSMDKWDPHPTGQESKWFEVEEGGKVIGIVQFRSFNHDTITYEYILEPGATADQMTAAMGRILIWTEPVPPPFT